MSSNVILGLMRLLWTGSGGHGIPWGWGGASPDGSIG